MTTRRGFLGSLLALAAGSRMLPAEPPAIDQIPFGTDEILPGNAEDYYGECENCGGTDLKSELIQVTVTLPEPRAARFFDHGAGYMPVPEGPRYLSGRWCVKCREMWGVGIGQLDVISDAGVPHGTMLVTQGKLRILMDRRGAIAVENPKSACIITGLRIGP